MTKSLMVMSAGAVAQATGSERPLIGGGGTNSTDETRSQMAASQEAVFSNLSARITAGGSGTNNIRFRNATADGNQLATISGTGLAEDLVNTDTVAAAGLFNLAFTDTGTDPTYTWVKANVEFSSGHGSFHGAASASIVVDVPSATRFNAFAGPIDADFNSTEARAQMKVRAYDTFAAMQVRALSNARTNDSVFKNRINGADGTGLITFGAGVTGLVQDTAVGDAIADGDLICMSVTLLTGVEDLALTLVACTLTSSTAKCDCFSGQTGGVARTASATANYFPLGGAPLVTAAHTEANARIKAGFDGTASNLRIYISANTYTGSATLKLYKNGSAVITTTINAAATGWIENTTDTATFVAADELSFELDEGTSGSITFHALIVTLEDTTVVAGVTYPMLERGTRGIMRGVVTGSYH